MRPVNSLTRSITTRVRIILVMMCALAILGSPSFAQEELYEAGVIIDYGDDRVTWVWIPFDEPETPLIDLLNASGLDLVTVGFGGLGEGVCQIDDTGCSVADCQKRLCQTSSTSAFWRVMKLKDDQWTMTSSGVSGSKVVDGEIYALSWSAVNPALPVVSIEEIATNAGAERNASDRVAAIHTDGESSKSASSPVTWAPAIAAFGLVFVVAALLVVRARSKRGVST